MTVLMNIQEFSKRTGISKSALRFYEEKNLIVPMERSVNGYRVYAEGQVDTVKLISSLRLANIPIKDIQVYLLENDEAKRQQMLENWISNIKMARDHLTISLRYLESNSLNKEIYLIERSEEQIIWFTAESKIGEFKEHFLIRGNELQKLNIPFNHCYLKYQSGKDVVKVNIGFGIPVDSTLPELTGITSIEQLPKCICIAMPYKESLSTIQDGYKKLSTYAVEHNWIPISPILEWYHGLNFTELDLLMPVTQIERRGE